MKQPWTPATLLLAAITAIALYLSYMLFRPYAGPILFAAVIAIVFHPLHGYPRRVLRNENAAALASMLAAMLLTAIPLFFLAVAVSNELAALYRSLSAKSAGDGGVAAYTIHALQRMAAWSETHLGLPQLDVRGIAMRRLEEASAALVQLGAGLVGNVFSLITDAVIAAIVLFFAFRDGENILARLATALPLGPERFKKLQSRIGSTVIANFYGGVAVGAVQGALTGVGFWAVGIQSPILWGVVTAVFSLVPVVGSAAVWVPASVILIFSGHIAKGIILLVWGAGVVGIADNVIRPWIISERVRMHTIYVFFALLGGVEVFGVIGLFVGPVILSVTAALLSMLKEDLTAGRAEAAAAEGESLAVEKNS